MLQFALLDCWTTCSPPKSIQVSYYHLDQLVPDNTGVLMRLAPLRVHEIWTGAFPIDCHEHILQSINIWIGIQEELKHFKKFNTNMPEGTMRGRSISSSLSPLPVLDLGVLAFLVCEAGWDDPLFPTEPVEGPFRIGLEIGLWVKCLVILFQGSMLVSSNIKMRTNHYEEQVCRLK